MHLERMKKLVTAVMSQAIFDIDTWAKKTECGTSACAVGSYILANPGCGLSLRYYPGRAGNAEILDDGTGARNWDAVEDHFELDGEEAMDLFGSERNPGGSKNETIERISDAIAELEDRLHRGGAVQNA